MPILEHISEQTSPARMRCPIQEPGGLLQPEGRSWARPSPGGNRSLFQATCLRPLHTPHYADGHPKPVPRAATLSLVNQRPAVPLGCGELILFRSRFALTNRQVRHSPNDRRSRSPISWMNAVPWSRARELQVRPAAHTMVEMSPNPRCQSEDTLSD